MCQLIADRMANSIILVRLLQKRGLALCAHVFQHLCLVLLRTTIMCLSIGTPKSINFPFVTNGKLMIFAVLLYKHMTVLSLFKQVQAQGDISFHLQ